MKAKVKCYPATIYERVGYSCNQCECTAGRKSIVSNHMVVVHQGNRHNCNQCSQKATQTGYLQRHNIQQALFQTVFKMGYPSLQKKLKFWTPFFKFWIPFLEFWTPFFKFWTPLFKFWTHFFKFGHLFQVLDTLFQVLDTFFKLPSLPQIPRINCIQPIHQEIHISCSQCNYKSKTKHGFNQNVKSVHDEVHFLVINVSSR